MSEDVAADSGTTGLQTNEIPVSDNVGGKPQDVSKPEPRQKLTTRDSVRAAIEETVKAAEKPEAKAEPEGETAEQKAERLRNEKGQFAKAEDKSEVKPDLKPDQQVKTEGEKPPKAHIEPPAHWMGEDKIGWRNVPQSVRQTIMNDYKAMGEAKQQLESVERVLTPQRRQMLTQAYGNDLQGLDNIFQTVEFSNRDPKGFIQWFANQYRIPLNEFAQGTQGQPQVDPQAQQLQQYLQPVLEPLLGKVSAFDKFMQEQATQKEQAMLGIVNAFMNDSTNFPYAKDVEGDVLTLLGTGKYTGTPEQKLKAAYDAAVWANPAIRSRMLAEQTQAQQRQQSQVADQKRSLAGSVTGAPGTAKPLANGSYVKESPRDSVRRALQEAGRI